MEQIFITIAIVLLIYSVFMVLLVKYLHFVNKRTIGLSNLYDGSYTNTQALKVKKFLDKMFKAHIYSSFISLIIYVIYFLSNKIT